MYIHAMHAHHLWHPRHDFQLNQTPTSVGALISRTNRHALSSVQPSFLLGTVTSG